MDHLEILKLKKEITTEVREDVTKYVWLRTTSRLFYALMSAILELSFWLLVIASVVKDSTVRDALLTCVMLAGLRIGQAVFFNMYNEK